MTSALIFTLVSLTNGYAAEVSAPASCIGTPVESGDNLTVTEPCRLKDVPFEQSSYAIVVDVAGLPAQQGGTFSKFTVHKGNESFEVTTLGNPSVEDVRKRKFKTMNDADNCMHRRRFILSKASTVLQQKVIMSDFPKVPHGPGTGH